MGDATTTVTTVLTATTALLAGTALVSGELFVAGMSFFLVSLLIYFRERRS